MNTDAFTFELTDSCLASNGLTITRIPYAGIDWPSTYFYDGTIHTFDDGSPIEYGASIFSTSDANCPIVSYTCHQTDSSFTTVGASCGYGDSTTDTELSFDTSTGTFNFRSSDYSDA